MQSLTSAERRHFETDLSPQLESDFYAGLTQVLDKPIVEVDSRGAVRSFNVLFQQACVEDGLSEMTVREEISRIFETGAPRGAFGMEIKFEVGMFSTKRRARIQFVQTDGENDKCWIGIIDISSEVGEKTEFSDYAQSRIYSARLAAVAEMSSGIAHEINNPLTVVLAKSHLIEKIVSGLELPEAVTLLAAVKKISTHAQRISKIIKGLKNFSRDESGDVMKVFNVVDAVEECVSLSTERFKAKGILLYVDVKEKEMLVKGRDYQISQILINLLNNAFDAVSSEIQREIHVEAFAENNQVLIRCWDSGPGVNAELEQKIMLPFFTTKPTGAGTGLGLSISLGIANVHGGRLYLNRDVSDSCFELALPAKAA